MSTTVQNLASTPQVATRHQNLIAIGFAIQLLDVELFRHAEEQAIDVYIGQVLHCQRHPNTPRPRMPLSLRPWADDAQW